MTTNQKSKKPTKPKARGPQPERKPQGGGKPPRQSRVAKVPREHLNTVLGIINPFSAAARGSKYPDESSMKTLPFQRHERFTLSSDATTFGGAIILPNYSYNFVIPGATFNALQITAPATVSLFAGRISCDNYRIVSWGLKISNIAAPLASSGMVSIRGWSAMDSSALAVTNALSYSSSFSEDIPLQDCKEVLIVGQVADIVSTQFTDTMSDFAASEAATAPFNAWVRRGFNPLSVYFSGVPASSPVLTLELIVNYELGFYDHDGMGVLATQAPEFLPHVHNAHKNVRSKMKNVFKKGSEQLAKHAIEAAGTALANYLAPGSGAAVPMLVD